MKFERISLVMLLTGIIIFILLFPKYCSSPSPAIRDTVTTTKYDTTYVTTKVKSPVYIPGETKYLPGTTTFLPVDTNAILSDYYASRIYNDTILIDSFGFVAFHDSVSRNKIAGRQNEKNYKIPVITKEVTKEITVIKPCRKLYGGVLVDPMTFGGVGMMSYKTKTDKLYHAGAGASIKGGFSIMGGVSVPLWRSK